MVTTKQSLRDQLIEIAKRQNFEHGKLDFIVAGADRERLSEALAPLREALDFGIPKELREEYERGREQDDSTYDSADRRQKRDEFLFKTILDNLWSEYNDAQDMTLEAIVADDLDRNREKIITALIPERFKAKEEFARYHLGIGLEDSLQELTSIIAEGVVDGRAFAVENEDPTEKQLDRILSSRIRDNLLGDLRFYASHVITLKELEESTALNNEELKLIVRNNLAKNSEALIEDYLASRNEDESKELVMKTHDIYSTSSWEESVTSVGYAKNVLASRRLWDLPKIVSVLKGLMREV